MHFSRFQFTCQCLPANVKALTRIWGETAAMMERECLMRQMAGSQC